MVRLLLWLWYLLLRILGIGPRRRGDPGSPSAVSPVLMMQQEVQALRLQMDSRLDQLQTSLTSSQEGVGNRLLETARAVGDVREGLGKLEGATARILEVGQGVVQLQEALRPPTLRGALGELLLEEMISQVLPKELYQTQYQFRSGDRVDAVIRLPAGLLPIDAKFPLDAFRDMTAAQEEAEKRRRRRDFHAAVRSQAEDIARKYIRPDENTLDLAFMYIPAENVYYEIVLRDDSNVGLAQHCLKLRVIPVSPLSFYAHLQALAIGLRGMRIEENARTVLGMLSRLRSDLDAFEEDFRVLGGHVRNAQNKYQDARDRLETLDRRLESAEGVQQPLSPASLPGEPSNDC